MNVDLDHYQLTMIKYGLKLLHREFLGDENIYFKRTGQIMVEYDLLELRDKLESLNKKNTSS